MLKLPSISYLRHSATAAFRRFPLVLLSALVCAAVFMWIVHRESSEGGYEIVRLMFTSALGIPLFLVIALAIEQTACAAAVRIACMAAGLVLLGLYHGATIGTLTQNHYVRYFQLALAAHLAAAFVAFIREARPDRFWQFNKSLFTRFLLSTLYAYVLFFGAALALSAVDRLFDVKIKGEVYSDLWIFCVFVFQTWHFLAGVPEIHSPQLSASDNYPNGLKIFAQYLLIPLITVYGVILYVYLGKVCVTGKWPEGLVGWMVSAMAVGGIFNLLLIQPVKEQDGNRWMRVYEKVFYASMVPLIGMLFASLYIRVRQYGFTERRYLLAVLGLWLLGVAIYFLARKAADIRRIPQSLCALALITSFGPWGAYSVSLHSQMARLERLLVKNGLIKEGRVAKIEGVITFADRKEISATLDYIIRNHGLDPLEAWFEPEWIAGQRKEFIDHPTFFGVTRHSAAAFTKLMGFDYAGGRSGGPSAQHFYYHADRINREMVVDGFETLAVIRYGHDTTSLTLMGDTCLALLDRERGIISIVRLPDAPLAAIDAGAVARSIWERPGMEKFGHAADFSDLTYDTETPTIRARFVFERLNGEVESDRLRVTNYSGYLLYRRK